MKIDLSQTEFQTVVGNYTTLLASEARLVNEKRSLETKLYAVQDSLGSLKDKNAELQGQVDGMTMRIQKMETATKNDGELPNDLAVISFLRPIFVKLSLGDKTQAINLIRARTGLDLQAALDLINGTEVLAD